MKTELEEVIEQRGLDTIMTLAKSAIDMYHALVQKPKYISTKKANSLYGECRMQYWSKTIELQTSATKKGFVRYNQNQLDSLMRAEKQYIK